MSERDNPYSASLGGQMTASARFGENGASSVDASPAPAARGGPAAAPAGMAAGNLVKETTTAGFTADVLQESRRQPVLVDFWAPWCGPCRQVTPILERAVTAAAGRVKLVTLNIDDHPAN
ncbi:MAG: thioredoxin family protein, partial [Pararhizobium sp.]